MNQKDKSSHAANAIAKAALYEDKAIEDKKDIRAAIEAFQLELDKKNNHQPPHLSEGRHETVEKSHS
ncbi:MAG: hypothetical protein WCI95_00015 [bacterium]